jgi:hypothetical protein
MRFVSFELDSQEVDTSHLHTNGGRNSQLHSQGSVQSNPNAGMHFQFLSTDGSNGADGIDYPLTSSAKEQHSLTSPDAVRPMPSAANIMRNSPRQLVALDLQEDAIAFVEMTQGDSPRFTSSPSEQVAHILSPTNTKSASVPHDQVQGFVLRFRLWGLV